ncbi:MAG TPA: dTDP-4-amino-4,6-dideoxygalactose transaminase [Saprospiraceae bacterium]|nr:dTDP-4-amino-4,6-dideoxygalactose transaminase [Saprospiraceae bacterium]
MNSTHEHISFNRPLQLGPWQNLKMDSAEWPQAIAACEQLLSPPTSQAFLTPSCTASLEMAALLCGLQPKDQVILPSFTHPSTANAFALRGCQLCFVDVDPATMNIAPQQIAAAVNKRTKAVVVTHYAGIAADLDAILDILEDTHISLIEDAAHCIGAQFKGQQLGTFGRVGALSFHHTKNIHCGEGGAIWVNRANDIEPANIIREKGTNRTAFARGALDHYHWTGLGSSFTISPLCAAYLLPQLQQLTAINERRLTLWQLYFTQLSVFAQQLGIGLPHVSEQCVHNGHIFYLICRTPQERISLQAFLKAKRIDTASHYVPLHSTPAGRRYGTFPGKDKYTTDYSKRLLRLPLYDRLCAKKVERVVESIKSFYHVKW